MAYTPQTWTDGVSKLNATRMGHIETGIADIHNLVDAKGDLYTATAADTPARLAVGANNTVVTADSAQSTGLKYSLVTNSMVDAAAAIAYSKLNLTGSIVNADVNASAAIAFSKLASAAFTTYTPSWTGTTTNPVIGNGTIAGRYIQIGKIVFVTILLTAGSTTTYGSGSYRLSLPVTAQSGSSPMAGGFRLVNQGTAYYVLSPIIISTTTITGTVDGALDWNPTSPFTFGSGDQAIVGTLYEAA